MGCSGNIQVAFYEGTHVIKLSGDIRLNLCGGLDDYLDEILSTPNFKNIIIDLSKAEAIDSTILGQLAKVSILSRERFNITPTIVSPVASITRLLKSMGFEQVFHLIHEPFKNNFEYEEWITDEINEEEGRQQVIEAHRVLMSLNDKNKSEFQDLVNLLEAESHNQ